MRCAHNVLCDEDGVEGSVHCSRSGRAEEWFIKEVSLNGGIRADIKSE